MITRRMMLSVSAMTAATAWMTDKIHAAPVNRKFTVDLRGGSIGAQAGLHDTIDLAAKHGFESVNASAHELGDMSDAEIDTTVEKLRNANLVWGSAGLPVDFRKDESKFKEDLSALPKRAKALQTAGVTRMGTWIMPAHDRLTYLENFKLHVDRLRPVAKILNDHGIRFGLEYVGTKTSRIPRRFHFIHTMRETRELNDAIGVDNMGYVLDSWHWYTAGESADDIRSLKNEDVVACDLNDAPKGKMVTEQIDNQRELPVATGVIDAKSFLTALVDIGYDGPIRAEPFNKPLNQLDNDEACEKTSQSIRKAFELVGG